MDPLSVRLAGALMNAQAGGFLAAPPGLDGSMGLGIPGVSGVPQPSRWDAVVSVEAAGIPVEEVHFVALDDGTIVVEEDVPDGCLAPLAEAVERELDAPYRADAACHEPDIWAVGATRVAIATLSAAVAGDLIELTSYGRERSCTLDGEPCLPFPELEAIGERRGQEYVVRAERLDATTWVVDAAAL